jgi:hypothetical protein
VLAAGTVVVVVIFRVGAVVVASGVAAGAVVVVVIFRVGAVVVALGVASFSMLRSASSCYITQARRVP